ncbi:MAG: nitrile hydratase subunit beta [Acidimicrobiales bacterium]
MNGVHDLGGTDGMGPVVVEDDEPVFHSDWERAAFAFFALSFRAGFFNVDQFRYGIEQIPPAEYLASRYYEHWLHSVEHAAVKAGAVDPDELEERTRYYLEHPDEPLPDRQDPELVSFVEAASSHGAPARRDSDATAKFRVGDAVRVLSDSPLGHTRRARYIRGKTGVVERAHGTFIYPDSAGNGGDADAQHVYTVRFEATQLWGAEAADPNGSVTFDVWEPYLESED